MLKSSKISQTHVTEVGVWYLMAPLQDPWFWDFGPIPYRYPSKHADATGDCQHTIYIHTFIHYNVDRRAEGKLSWIRFRLVLDRLVGQESSSNQTVLPNMIAWFPCLARLECISFCFNVWQEMATDSFTNSSFTPIGHVFKVDQNASRCSMSLYSLLLSSILVGQNVSIWALAKTAILCRM